MITPMKKVTILCLDKEREASLEKLREMGILHVTPLVNPTGVKLNAAKSKVMRIRKALEAIPAKVGKDAVALDESVASQPAVEAVHQMVQVKKDATDEISKLHNDLNRLNNFGNLDPKTVQSLEESGIFVKLYEVDPSKTISADDGAVVLPFGQNLTGNLYAVISMGEAPAAVKDAVELPLPSMSLAEMRQKLSAANAELAKAEKTLECLAAKRSEINSALDDADDEYDLPGSRKRYAGWCKHRHDSGFRSCKSHG